MKEYKLQKNVTIGQLKANRFTFKAVNTYALTVPLYFYKSEKGSKYVTILMTIYVNMEKSTFEYEIIDENNLMYTPFYNRQYGVNKLNKILDKKIIQEFKLLEKKGILEEMKEKKS